MKTWDSKSMSYRYLTNNEIDKTKKEILSDRLQRINDKLNSINFQKELRNDPDFMSEIYSELLKQKEYIENKLQI